MFSNNFMQEAIKQAKKALTNNEIPVGCVIVNNTTKQVVAQSYNQTLKNPLMHAEIIALKQALKQNNGKPLSNHSIYITLEPCLMCYGAIANCGIKYLYFGLPCSKTGAVESNQSIAKASCANIESYGFFNTKEIKDLMQSFFNAKRKNKTN